MGRSCQFHWHLALQPQGVEHHHQTFKNDLYPRCNIQMRRNRLTSVLAYHPFHHVPREPVDEIFFSSLVQPKDNTAIQYFYLWFFNQSLGHSHLQLRLRRGFRSYMDPRERRKSDVFLSCPYLLRPKWYVMASFFHDSSPPAFHRDRICWRYLQRSCCRCPYCMPIASWFQASGLCLWFRLSHVRNAWRFSLSRCQTPRKTKRWTWQPRSATNFSVVVRLRRGYFQFVLLLKWAYKFFSAENFLQ